MALSPQCVPLLRDIVAATKSPQGFMFVNPKSPIARTLVSNGFVESNPATVDPTNADKIAFRATVAGYAELPIEEAAPNAQPIATPPAHSPATPLSGTPETTTMQTQTQPAPAAASRGGPRGPRIAPAVAPITGFRFASLPEAAKRGPGAGSGPGESYPFSKLGEPDESGVDSFFVHPTEQNPSPFKLVRQAVNSANKRHKDAGRAVSFKAVDMPADPEHQKPGVRVFRVA